jgi:hypothetical protein
MVSRAAVALVAASSFLAVASSAPAGALEDCGQRVIRDWYSGGRVDKVYPLPCYRAAIRVLPDDVLQYTDAGAAIERALETARQGLVTQAGRTTDETQPAPARTSTPAKPAPAAKAKPKPAPRRARSAPPHDPARLATGPARETSEAGIPYPLIALAALSLVLLASGIAAGLAHRRR